MRSTRSVARPADRRAGPGRGLRADPEQLIVVGEITRAHGVRGEVRVLPVTDFPDRLLRLTRAVLVQGGAGRPVRIARARPAGRLVVMKLAGIDTPEAAEALRGATLRVRPEEAPRLPAGQFYVFQIVGLAARTPDGRVVGTVVDVLRTGSNDVYVVRPPEGQAILLPAVEGVVESIDLARGELVVRPPEWL